MLNYIQSLIRLFCLLPLFLMPLHSFLPSFYNMWLFFSILFQFICWILDISLILCVCVCVCMFVLRVKMQILKYFTIDLTLIFNDFTWNTGTVVIQVPVPSHTVTGTLCITPMFLINPIRQWYIQCFASLLEVGRCRGPAPVDPGNSKRGWRWRDQKTSA